MTLTKEDIQALHNAAFILTMGRSDNIQDHLAAAMIDLAEHYPQSGANSHKRWLASLQALGETCLTLAKRERNKSP